MKGQTCMQKLDPQYIIGFVDGEGCFCVSVSKHKTLRRRIEIRPMFEIELRSDDREILERIKDTLKCGNIYTLKYKRYDWQEHVKFKVSNISELVGTLIPFFDKYPLQGKKKEVYKRFRSVVLMMYRKEHLSSDGFKRILKLRDEIRSYSKKHYRNR